MKKRKKRITVPVIMQMETLECGAASLAMILAYHGKWLPLEQVRSDCGVSRDGSKASNNCPLSIIICPLFFLRKPAKRIMDR